jgi:hypothetical protein
MRALFWHEPTQLYVETRNEKDAAVLREVYLVECTGDLEDEAAAARQFTNEEDEDE